MNRPRVSFEKVFDAAPVGMLVVDRHGAILDLNRQLEQLFGYRRDELLGRSVDELVDGASSLHRERREAFVKAPEARPMGAGRDLYGRHRDGRRIPVEIGLTPLETETGLCVLASVVDLSERKRAEEQFHLAIEAAPNGMMLVDASGRIILVNAQIEQLFGYTREELIGQSVDALLPARYRGGHHVSRGSFFANPRARPMGAGRELYGLRKDGREVPVEIGLSPIQTANGQLVLSSIVDITERKQAREQLQASLHEKEVLLKELHHRAKNNLQLIASLLDLGAGAGGAQALAECRERIHSISLVHEKLYQSGTFARIDFADYLRSLGEQIEQAWSRVGDEQVSLGVECAEFSLPLDTAIPCGLVVNELLTNAFKHAFPPGRGGRITLRAAATAGRIVIDVIDDGVGMKTGAAERKGHIGLELVNALARQLRGEVRFQSQPGTSIRLDFPEASS